MLRFDRMRLGTAEDGQGRIGDPSKATALFGRRIAEMPVEDSVVQIRAVRAGRRR